MMLPETGTATVRPRPSEQTGILPSVAEPSQFVEELVRNVCLQRHGALGIYGEFCKRRRASLSH